MLAWRRSRRICWTHTRSWAPATLRTCRQTPTNLLGGSLWASRSSIFSSEYLPRSTRLAIQATRARYPKRSPNESSWPFQLVVSEKSQNDRGSLETVPTVTSSRLFRPFRNFFDTLGWMPPMTFCRRLEYIQCSVGVWKCLRSLPPDPKPNTG